MGNDMFIQKNEMPKTDGKTALLTQITLKAQHLNAEQIQVFFDLTDEQMGDPEIQKAIKKGAILVIDEMGDLLIQQARSGKMAAIKMLFEINGGKQPQKTYNLGYQGKDAAALEAAEQAAKNSPFAE